MGGEMILVIAVNKNHFIHWCREVGLNPNDRSSVRYIYETALLDGLIGRKDVEILTLPEWYREKKRQEIDYFNMLINEHKKRREAKCEK